jgi:uncharacterized membrane protein
MYVYNVKSFSHKLHLLKAVSWRITGSVDTMIWGWVLSGDWTFGMAIGASEMLSKLVLYYLHDRLWHKTEISGRWSIQTVHVIKTITWRILGTFDTVMLSWYISGSLKLGLQLGGIEIITKMVLYYLHERIWYRIKWNSQAQSVSA